MAEVLITYLFLCYCQNCGGTFDAAHNLARPRSTATFPTYQKTWLQPWSNIHCIFHWLSLTCYCSTSQTDQTLWPYQEIMHKFASMFMASKVFFVILRSGFEVSKVMWWAVIQIMIMFIIFQLQYFMLGQIHPSKINSQADQHFYLANFPSITLKGSGHKNLREHIWCILIP